MVGRPEYQNWQHVYTAVTRGRSRVFIIHNCSHLQSAVTTDPIPRYTRLKEFLKDESAEPGRRLQEIALLCGDGLENSGLTFVSNSDPENEVEFDEVDDDLLIQASQLVESDNSLLCDSGLGDNGLALVSNNEPENEVEFDEVDDDLLIQASQLEDDLTFETTPEVISDPVALPVESPVQSDERQHHTESGLPSMNTHDDFFISRENLHRLRGPRDKAFQGGYTQLEDVDRFPATLTANLTPPQTPPRASFGSCFPSPAWTPPTSTPRKALPHEGGKQGNGDKRVAVPSSESKYSPRPGNQVQSGCQSFVPSPSRTSAQHSMPKGPGHHQASYSSPTRTTPTKRREEAENQFESPGKRPKGMTARYPGRCGICSSPIRADVDMITVQREPKKTWIHLTCYGKT